MNEKIGTFAVEDCCLSIIVTGEVVQDKTVEDDWPNRHLMFTNAVVNISTGTNEPVLHGDTNG